MRIEINDLSPDVVEEVKAQVRGGALRSSSTLLASDGTSTEADVPRQQINQITSFIDASNVY